MRNGCRGNVLIALSAESEPGTLGHGVKIKNYWLVLLAEEGVGDNYFPALFCYGMLIA
jgi:hypothetical protein